MKTSRELKEQRGQMAQTLKALHDKAINEKREFTPEEKTEWETRSKEFEQLEADIAAAEKREAFVRTLGGAPTPGKDEFSQQDKKDLRKFNIATAIAELRSGKLKGVNAEVNSMGADEQRSMGVSGNGLSIPAALLKICSTEERRAFDAAEKRALTATGGSNGSEGGVAIATDVMELIPALKPTTVIRDLGATSLDGLVGNLRFPRNNNVVSASWEGEVSDADDASNTFDGVSLTPKRLAAFAEISWLLLQQNAQVSRQFVATEIEQAIARALELAIINGTGSGQPLGILNDSNVNNTTVAWGTNGGVPTYDLLVGMESVVADSNAPFETMGFLTTPRMFGKLKTTRKDAGSGLMVGNQVGPNLEVVGYNAKRSTLVPGNLTLGTSSGNCHAIIFGNWAEALIGSWGGLFITIDDITKAKQATSVVTVNSWFDFAMKHPKSFAFTKGALLA